MRKTGISFLFLAFLLAGCDLSQFNLTNKTVEPKSSETCVFGLVLDRFNMPLPGAMVTNGADVFYTLSEDRAVFLGNENGGYITLPAGYFVLQHIPVADDNKGATSIRAIYDGVSSNVIQVQLEKKSTNYRLTAGSSKTYKLVDENDEIDTEKVDALQNRYNVNLVAVNSGNYDHAVTIPVEGAIQSNDEATRNCLRFLGSQAINNNIDTSPNVTADVATDSVKSYNPTDGIMQLVFQAPPGSSGTTIGGYSIDYYNTVTNAKLFNETSQKTIGNVIVMPAAANQSGQKAYVPVDTAANPLWPIKMRDLNVGVSARIYFFPPNSFSAGNRIKRLERTLDSNKQIVTKTVDLSVEVILKIKRD
ncbi:MAG TPA: hypothetical protein DD435_09390 [Cyanobacteria bacterium UBA8530]|nr:hypothetical protein [Cyanobacteria bacterium UBA8530]